MTKNIKHTDDLQTSNNNKNNKNPNKKTQMWIPQNGLRWITLFPSTRHQRQRIQFANNCFLIELHSWCVVSVMPACRRYSIFVLGQQTPPQFCCSCKCARNEKGKIKSNSPKMEITISAKLYSFSVCENKLCWRSVWMSANAPENLMAHWLITQWNTKKKKVSHCVCCVYFYDKQKQQQQHRIISYMVKSLLCASVADSNHYYMKVE